MQKSEEIACLIVFLFNLKTLLLNHTYSHTSRLLVLVECLLLLRRQQASLFPKGGLHHDMTPHLHSLLTIYENYLIAINSLLLFGDIIEEEQSGLII